MLGEGATVHLTETDRILAGLAAAYMAYRLWSGMKVGVVYGDGDRDVHAETHPTAYVLTALSCVLVIAILGYVAIGQAGVATILTWLGRPSAL